ncbi:uncharacterized protein LOC107365470 [Tetranychus urticae]|uniref:Uncharacterized protein n=1 Tax=Tetranychus urticae TaxID=32264 RepID=T1KN18_TETUR|nr:uncharacterized protein LOC107365470 [Tetranychus urticae]
MAQHNNNSDKITFKVKHLNEYHDIVIDCSKDRCRYPNMYQQVFEQLESITGVPTRYTSSVYIPWPDEVNLPRTFSVGFFNHKAYTPDLLPNFPNYSRDDYREDDTRPRKIRDGERYHLQYYAEYAYRVSKRISLGYFLVAERYVTEGACSQDFCQHQCTESHFKRLKDLVSNDELNEKITQLVEPLMNERRQLIRERYSEAVKIFSEFNIKQYLRINCVEQRRPRTLWIDQQHRDLYLRTRG